MPVPHTTQAEHEDNPSETRRLLGDEEAMNMLPDEDREVGGCHMALNYISDATGQVYRLGHLFLPSVYISRVDQLISESGLDIRDIVDITFCARSNPTPTQNEAEAGASRTPPAYEKLQEEWKDMIDDFIEEWRTLTIISAMLIP
jgi:hypothetical protein